MENFNFDGRLEKTDFEKRLEMRQQEARERILGLKQIKETTEEVTRKSRIDNDFYASLKVNIR